MPKINKIISGGQTGADRVGLDVAMELNIFESEFDSAKLIALFENRDDAKALADLLEGK